MKSEFFKNGEKNFVLFFCPTIKHFFVRGDSMFECFTFTLNRIFDVLSRNNPSLSQFGRYFAFKLLDLFFPQNLKLPTKNNNCSTFPLKSPLSS